PARGRVRPSWAPACGRARGRRTLVLHRVALGRARLGHLLPEEEIDMNRLSRRDLIIAAAGCAAVPLTGRAAELKVDLSQERVGQPPTTFQPVVGTWRVVQDGPEKVIMVDGLPWKAAQNNRTSLLAERARAFYN